MLLVLWLGLFALPVMAADDAGDEDVEGLPAIASRSDVIIAIEFSGNKVTREQILRQEMVVREGDPANPALIERSRQAIMDLGLFTSVRAAVEQRPEGSILRIAVKEKYYILPVPKLNRDDEYNFTLGAEITVDNMAGLNQQLKLRYESEDADNQSGGQITTYSLGYTYPRMFGGPWLLSGDWSQQNSPAEELTGTTVTSLYDRQAWSAALRGSRWLHQTGPSRGWQAGGGLIWRKDAYDHVSGTANRIFDDITVMGVTVNAQFTEVSDYLFSRQGVEYGYLGEYGAPLLGSETDYTRHEFYYRKYILLEGRPHENIDMQWKLGLSSGEMFPGDVTSYALGGSRSLRAYSSGSIAGNSYMLINLQYLRPLFGYYQWRGVVFMDIGNAYPSNTEMHLGDLRWDVGIGMRLRLKSFVKIDLRIDASYAYDTGESRVFAGTREMF